MPQQTDNDPRFLLVDESVLPEVFAKVVEAKDLSLIHIYTNPLLFRRPVTISQMIACVAA